jgi:acetylornithine deacetylase/succinyl-diaminopimelate desuccinylase-like protein
MDIKFLSRLVELDTNSESKSNYESCVELIQRRAESAGFQVEVHHAKSDDGKPRPNIIVELDAGAKQTLLLATHYDIVPAGGGWSHPPFKLTIEKGRAYGRGAADDKGGILSAIAAMETLRKRNSSRVNVKLLITCDEEVGGEHGLGFLMKMKKSGHFLVDGDAAILIDSGPHVYIGSSGRISGKIGARGSLSQLLSLLSAIMKYSGRRSKIISKLRESSGRRVWGRISVTMLSLSAGAIAAKAGVKSNIIPGECHIKLRNLKKLKKFLPRGRFKLHGDEVIIFGRQGHAGYPHLYDNAIKNSLPILRRAAELCDEEGGGELVFDLRTIPEENLSSALEEFERYLKEINPEAELEVKERSEGYVLQESHPFVGMLKRAVGERKAYGMLGGTDAHFLSSRSIPALCFGPVADESNAHGKDEFVKLKDLELVASSLVKLCESWKN